MTYYTNKLWNIIENYDFVATLREFDDLLKIA